MNKEKNPHQIAHQNAREIAHLLGEKHYGFIGQIRRVVRLCGIDFAREIYTATVEIEANGGIMLPDNSRRRTPGGIFLNLVRSKVDKDQWKLISSGGAKAHIPLLSWKKRIELIQSLQTAQGQVKSVMVSLKGRPDQIEKRAEFVVVTLSHTLTPDNFPRALPAPPSTPTIFTIYVAPEQWEKAEVVLADPSNKLVIEGICTVDSETQNQVVFATAVSKLD